MSSDPTTADRFDDLIRRGERLSAWLRELSELRADDNVPDQGYWRVAYAFYDPAVVRWRSDALALTQEALGTKWSEGLYYDGLGLHGCTVAAMEEATAIMREAKADFERGRPESQP